MIFCNNAAKLGGCKIAAHASLDLFADEENHGILKIDASNAFNRINRAVVQHNMNILCLDFATYVYNCYQIPVRLFILGGKELQSTKVALKLTLLL